MCLEKKKKSFGYELGYLITLKYMLKSVFGARNSLILIHFETSVPAVS